jgi:hypothetical protein
MAPSTRPQNLSGPQSQLVATCVGHDLTVDGGSYAIGPGADGEWYGSPNSGAGYSCSPHSVLSSPDQRPARECSPGATGRVQGQQPIEV